jgi:hypothetical protein
MMKCDEGEDDMWIGVPGIDQFPQICETNQCEPYIGRRSPVKTTVSADADGGERLGNREDDSGVSGHGMELTGETASGFIWAGLQSAKQKGSKIKFTNSPHYHTFPFTKFPREMHIKHDVTALIMPIEVRDAASTSGTKKLYFGVEINRTSGLNVTPAADVTIRPGTGRQFSVTFKVPNEKRKALVWLKE